MPYQMFLSQKKKRKHKQGEIFGNDGYGYYLNSGASVTRICLMSKLTKFVALNMCRFLCINSTSVKLLEKKERKELPRKPFLDFIYHLKPKNAY
jgi:hypothetical protein